MGQYAFVVDWNTEPAYEGLKNAVYLRVAGEDSEQPIEGLDTTVKVEVTHVPSNTARTFEFRGVFGTTGTYVVDMIPTSPGVYRFRIFGKVAALDVNEIFDSRGGCGGFDDIEATSAVQFPVVVAGVREIEGATRGAQTAAVLAQDLASSAKEAASSARVLAVAALVVGVAGALAGIGTFATRPRSR